LRVERRQQLAGDSLCFSFCHLLGVGDAAIAPESNQRAVLAERVFTIGEVPCVSLAMHVTS
jgi:hypothetical protein